MIQKDGTTEKALLAAFKSGMRFRGCGLHVLFPDLESARAALQAVQSCDRVNREELGVGIPETSGRARHALTNGINHYLQTNHWRISGSVICEKCGKEARRHPMCGPTGCNGVPFLHRMCDGRQVKL